MIAVDGSLRPTSPQPFIEGDHYLALLRGNFISMHATVMYRREAFETVGGFDTSVNACEDWDLYLRAARPFPICCHDRLVAEYQRGTNKTNPERMLESAVCDRASFPRCGKRCICSEKRAVIDRAYS